MAAPRKLGTIGRAYLGVAVVAGIAALIDWKVGIDVKVREEFTAFAVFYIVAQAAERLIEPLMTKVKATESETKKQAVKAARTATLTAPPAQAAEKAAAESEAEQELTKVQHERAIIGWAIASGFALIVCGLLGLGLIESVATVETDKDWARSLFERVDVIVTGLAVGAGTKPLHDLIARLEKSKQNADPATQASVPATTTTPAAGGTA